MGQLEDDLAYNKTIRNAAVFVETRSDAAWGQKVPGKPTRSSLAKQGARASATALYT